jgi:hypothetical protein
MNSKLKMMSMDRRVLLSAIWVFVLFNMIYADIIGQLAPGWLEKIDTYSQILDWRVLLSFSVLLEVPIGMTLLSRILNYKANRLLHAFAVPITILFVVLGGNTHPHYLFFTSIECLAMAATAWLAWQPWTSSELSHSS